LNFWLLPVAVSGSSPKATAPGALKRARFRLQNSMMSSAVGLVPFRGTTKALGTSPHLGAEIGGGPAGMSDPTGGTQRGRLPNADGLSFMSRFQPVSDWKRGCFRGIRRMPSCVGRKIPNTEGLQIPSKYKNF
jgi:hypothetical protein